MTKYTSSLLLLLIFGWSVKAQIAPSFIDTTKNQISIKGNYNQVATTLPLSLSNKFIFGGHIDTDLKNLAQSKLNSNNLLGFEGTSALSYIGKTNKKLAGGKAFWGIELSTNVLSYNNYSQDLFNLVFYGNAAYPDQNLNFDNALIQLNWFHKLNIITGFSSDRVGSFDAFQVMAKPFVAFGVQHINHSFSRGNILTESTGETISVDMAAEFAFTDSSYSATTPSGYGGGIDIAVLLKKGKHTLGLNLEDFGIVSWSDVHNYQIDTILDYEGFVVEDIFNLEDSLLTQESLLDSIFSITNSNSSQALPFAVSIFHQYDFSEKLNLQSWVRYRHAANYLPFVMTRLNYNLGKVEPGISASYGGYTGFQAGINAEVNLEIFDLIIGSTNVLGFIDQDNQFTRNFYGELRVKF